MPSHSHLRVRNFDRYQDALQDATKRTRIAFNIDAALLDPKFKGYGGTGRLGSWIKTLAWAARLENELPADTAWWRENFGRHGDQWRDKLVKWDWLTPVQADSSADSGADSSFDSGSPEIGDEPESKVPNSRPLTPVPPSQVERDSTPDVDGETPLTSKANPSTTASSVDVDNVVEIGARRKTDYRGIEGWDPGTRDVLAELLERRNG